MNAVMALIMGVVINTMLSGGVGLTVNNENKYDIPIAGKLNIAATKDSLNAL